MDHVINRQTGEVGLPEAGEGAFIRFTKEAFEKLDTAYGDEYINVIIKGLAQMKMPIYDKVIACTLQGSTNGNLPYDMRWEELNIRILDALNLAIYGKTYEEKRAEQEAEMSKKLEDLESNPQLAAILSLLSAQKPASEPD